MSYPPPPQSFLGSPPSVMAPSPQVFQPAMFPSNFMSFSSPAMSEPSRAPENAASLGLRPSQVSPMTPYRSLVEEQERQAQQTSNDRRNESMERMRTQQQGSGRSSSRSSRGQSTKRSGPAHPFPATRSHPQLAGPSGTSGSISSMPSPLRRTTHKVAKLAIFPYTLVSSRQCFTVHIKFTRSLS